MTDSLDDLVVALIADIPAVVTIVNDRIFTLDGLGRKGVMHDPALGIFNVKQVMQPTVITRLRPNIGWGGINDRALGVASSKQVIEVYIYDAPKHGYTTIRALGALIYPVLNGARTSLGELGWINTLEKGSDVPLEEAYFERLDFEIARINKPA